MHDKFEQLDEEKRNRIIDAAMSVFAAHSYNHATTDEITTKAGISKGLLFHYFGSKKNLYLYVFDYSYKMVNDAVNKDLETPCDDFFELIERTTNVKVNLMYQHPSMFTYFMKVLYDDKRPKEFDIKKLYDISAEMQKFNDVLSQVDKSKFKDNIDFEMVFHTVIWTSDSLARQYSMNGNLEIDPLLKDFNKYLAFYKTCFYKEEFQ